MDERPAGSPSHGQAPDPHDLIVGTVHAPDWLRRIPLVGWLFAALAVLGAAIELLRHGPLVGPTGLTTVNLIDVVAGSVFVGAIVALPAGVLVGRSRATRMDDRLYRGAVVLALATLLGLLWEAVAWQTRRAFEADDLFEIGLGQAGLATVAILGRSVQAAFVLIGGGLMALGLRDRIDLVRAGSSPSPWRWPLIVAGTFATAVALFDPVAFFILEDRPGADMVSGGWAPIDLVLLMVIAATPLAWTAIALAATRGAAAVAVRGRGWTLVAAGASLLVASTVVQAGLDLAAWYISSLPIDAQLSIGNDAWFAWTAGVGVLAAMGAALLLAGCAVGLGSVADQTISDRALVGHDPVDLTV